MDSVENVLIRQFRSLSTRLRYARTRGRAAIQNLSTFDTQLNLWICAVCAANNEPATPSREAMNCCVCGSTWRARAMVLGLLEALGYSPTALGSVAPNPSIRGVGISDVPAIDSFLRKKFGYVNTHLHKEPRLNLCSVTDEYRAAARFVICSDVLEHVPPPVEAALLGLRSLISNGGVAIISVPHIEEGKTDEFYPGLVEYEVHDGHVYWRDTTGKSHCDETPELHGGSGVTLAFRLWSLADLRTSLVRAGFTSVRNMTYNASLGVPEIGPQHSVLIATA